MGILKISGLRRLLEELETTHGDLPIYWTDSKAGDGPLKDNMKAEYLLGDPRWPTMCDKTKHRVELP